MICKILSIDDNLFLSEIIYYFTTCYGAWLSKKTFYYSDAKNILYEYRFIEKYITCSYYIDESCNRRDLEVIKFTNKYLFFSDEVYKNKIRYFAENNDIKMLKYFSVKIAKIDTDTLLDITDIITDFNIIKYVLSIEKKLIDLFKRFGVLAKDNFTTIKLILFKGLNPEKIHMDCSPGYLKLVKYLFSIIPCIKENLYYECVRTNNFNVHKYINIWKEINNFDNLLNNIENMKEFKYLYQVITKTYNTYSNKYIQIKYLKIIGQKLNILKKTITIWAGNLYDIKIVKLIKIYDYSFLKDTYLEREKKCSSPLYDSSLEFNYNGNIEPLLTELLEYLIFIDITPSPYYLIYSMRKKLFNMSVMLLKRLSISITIIKNVFSFALNESLNMDIMSEMIYLYPECVGDKTPIIMEKLIINKNFKCFKKLFSLHTTDQRLLNNLCNCACKEYNILFLKFLLDHNADVKYNNYFPIRKNLDYKFINILKTLRYINTNDENNNIIHLLTRFSTKYEKFKILGKPGINYILEKAGFITEN